MTEINAARIAKNGNVITPKGALMYPMLFTPGPLAKNAKDPKQFGWQTNLLIPKDADLSVLEAAVEEIIKEKFSPAVQKGKIVRPFLKTEDQARLAHLADDYPTLLRVKSKHYTKNGQQRSAPTVVGPAMNTIKPDDEADEVYSGRMARVSLQPFTYSPESGSKDYGVSLGMSNVQLLEHGEPLAGGKSNPNAEFEAVAEDGLGDLE